MSAPSPIEGFSDVVEELEDEQAARSPTRAKRARPRRGAKDSMAVGHRGAVSLLTFLPLGFVDCFIDG
jgi:hypothetical protein